MTRRSSQRKSKPRACKVCQDVFTPGINQGARKYCANCVPSQASISGTSTFGQRVRKYGIGLKDVQSLLDRQQGSCAMCPLQFEGPWDKRLHVDHDHTTKRVRGLLCMSCNVKLGIVENFDFVIRALDYLQCSATENCDTVRTT